MNIIFVCLAALVGGIANSLIGWAKQSPPEAWDGRKFITSFIGSLIGAVVIAMGFNYSGISNIIMACFASFLAGAGVQSGLVNISGAISMRGKAKT